MKTLYSLIILLAFFSACTNQKGNDQLPGSIVNNPASADGEAPTGDYPIISFDTTQFDFRSIKEGEVVTHTFNFKNTGTSNLVVTDVRASCGCTTPSWPKEIIKPGESNSITVKYNSEGREGNFNKGITVYCNAYPNTATLRIQGVVYPK